MTPAECMRVLGLGTTASLPEIKHAYRRLAHELHPDKHNGCDCEATRQRFIDTARAYRLLVHAARAAQAGRQVGLCCECLAFGEVARGLDGQIRCPACALRGRRRFLPLPAIQIARCTLTVIMLIASAYLLAHWTRHPGFHVALAALVLGVLGLITLAITCLRVLHCVSPPRARR